ncbi:hypothetical protein ACHAXS_000398, partial [Conticribra weissflogii]
HVRLFLFQGELSRKLGSNLSYWDLHHTLLLLFYMCIHNSFIRILFATLLIIGTQPVIMFRLPSVVATLAVVSSPNTVRAQSDIPVTGYSYVGEGPCEDGDAYPYDYYYFSGTLCFSTDDFYSYDDDGIFVTANECGRACTDIGLAGMVGFNLENDCECSCLFEDNIVTSSTPAGFSGFDSSNTGTGEISNLFYPVQGIHCYKVQPEPTSSPEAISKYSTIDADFGFYNATIAAGSSSSFQFEFTNSISGSTIHAAIVADTFCNDANSNYQVKDGITNTTIGPVVVNATLATITKQVESEVSLADKNNGAATLRYCLRADLYDDSDSSFSVGAKKVDLQLDIAYETESDFSIANILTSEFVVSSASASATR